ncbi:MAG: hypothetical protein J6L86_06215, partial [Alphaproteobacteria bacterium]|nr:hypothetical protein [Alphaproteobacteria bacterium]
AELADVVNLVAVRLLIIGAPFTRHVMATAVLTEPWNHVIRNAEVQDAPPAAAFPATLAEQFIMMGICPVTRLKAKHHVPAAHSTPDKAAAVAKQQKPLFFQRGFSFYQTHTNQNYRLSLKYSLAFLYFPV